MYDLPELRRVTDAWWAGLSGMELEALKAGYRELSFGGG
jgi:hypothetical protein